MEKEPKAADQMKAVVVDTNIIFSCLLNTQGTIGDLLFNSGDVFTFYCPEYMREEMRRHWLKLIRLSKLTDAQLRTAYDKLLTRLQFVSEALIPKSVWQQAAIITADIDEDDIDFVAMTKYLKAVLWTGDKQLYAGLKAKRFRTVYNTSELAILRQKYTRQGGNLP